MFRSKKLATLFLSILLLFVAVAPITNATSDEVVSDLPIKMTGDTTLEELAEYLDNPDILKSKNVTVIKPNKRNNAVNNSEDEEFEILGKEIFVINYQDEQEADTKNSVLSSNWLVFETQLGNDTKNIQIGGRLYLKAIVGKIPDAIDVTTTFKGSTRRDGSLTTLIGGSKLWEDPDVGQTSPWFVYTLRQTYYYKAEFVADVLENGKPTIGGNFRLGNTKDAFLLNKKAVQYPYYVDPKSGKVMPEPDRTDWARTAVTNACRLTDTEKTTYRDNYDKKYGKLDWGTGKNSKYHIHHVRPCFLGGNKDESNLFPLPADFHLSVVSPWFTNYGTNSHNEADDEI